MSDYGLRGSDRRRSGSKTWRHYAQATSQAILATPSGPIVGTHSGSWSRGWETDHAGQTARQRGPCPEAECRRNATAKAEHGGRYLGRTGRSGARPVGG